MKDNACIEDLGQDFGKEITILMDKYVEKGMCNSCIGSVLLCWGVEASETEDVMDSVSGYIMTKNIESVKGENK